MDSRPTKRLLRIKLRKEETQVKHSKEILRLSVLSMLVALGVVISPILRVEGMCPMAHFINIVCSVFLGPWYSLLCAVMIGIIRMAAMGIPPLALTGAVFGAFLSGVFYRLSGGRLLCAVAGEVLGTGVIGALMSYPVMTFLWGKEGLSWLFYVPSFVCGTLIGGSIAYVFLRKLAANGMLEQIQTRLGSVRCADQGGVLADALGIAALGGILFAALGLAANLFALTGWIWHVLPRAALAACLAGAVLYYVVKRGELH